MSPYLIARRLLDCLCLAVIVSTPLWAEPELQLWPEYVRSGPTGLVLDADASASPAPVPLAGARGGYVSFQIIVKNSGPGSYSLNLQWDGEEEADIFRQWYHRMENGNFIPDALIPLSLPLESTSPRTGQSYRRPDRPGILGRCLDKTGRAPEDPHGRGRFFARAAAS